MQVRSFYLSAFFACLMIAAPVLAQEGHPLVGSWHGNWGLNPTTRIDLTVPADTGFEVGAVSIVKGTKNLLGAQAFVDWVLTKEAGDLNTKLSNRGSVRTDVAPAPGAPTLTSVKLVNYDRQWATDNKTRIQKLWQTTVGIQ